MVTSRDPDSTGEKSLLVRIFHLVLSISLMTLVTVVAGYGGWAVLTLSAKLGGPDPKTADGELLRTRLLEWPQRNREFMKNNGHGEFPWPP